MRSWITVMGQTVHVTPNNDLIEHELEDECVCGPDIEYLGDGGKLVVHQSLDRREDRE